MLLYIIYGKRKIVESSNKREEDVEHILDDIKTKIHYRLVGLRKVVADIINISLWKS